MDISKMLSDFASWLLDVLLWVPRKIFAELLDAFANVFDLIPVPDFVTQADNYFSVIPSDVIYAIGFFKVPEGISMVISAYILRFIIRRIPFFG